MKEEITSIVNQLSYVESLLTKFVEYVEDEILSSFKHELWHIACNDFESRDSANRIEAIAHKAEKHNFYGFFDGVDLKPYLENAKVITYEGREKSA